MKITNVISSYSFQGRNGVIVEPHKSGTKSAPIGELLLGLNEGSFPCLIVDPMNGEEREAKFMEFLADAYRLHGHYGPYGDIIRARVAINHDGSGYFTIEYIAALAYHKPGLAADLVIFVTTKVGEYFVGIKRKKNPGADKVALIGGFRDIKVYEFEPAILTALREAKEEVGLDYQLTQKQEKTCREDLNLSQLEIEVGFGGGIFQAKFTRIGEFSTGDEEEVASLGGFKTLSIERLKLKRVYATTAFVLQMELPLRYMAKEIAEIFEAADDAKEIVVIPLGDLSKTEFGLSHHATIIQAALDKVWGGEETFRERVEW